MRCWILLVSLIASPVSAATYYVSLTGSDSNTCVAAQDPLTPKRTLNAGGGCLNAGDILYIRGGTWNEQLNLTTLNKTGTSTAWITIAGYPGETVILRFTDGVGGYGAIRAWGNRGYFIFRDLQIDGINYGNNVGWQVRGGNHHFIFRNMEFYNQFYHGLQVTDGSSDITIEDSKFHDMRSDCASGNKHHGLYLHHGANVLAQRNEIYNTPGGGIQLYPGPWTGAKLYYNYIHHTDNCAGSTTSSIVVATDDLGATGSIIGAEVVGNIVAFTNRSTTSSTTTGTASGIRVYESSAVNVVSGTKIHNNTIYKVYNPPSSTNGYCILLGVGAADTDIRNNVMTDCGGGSGGLETFVDLGTGTTASHNACTSIEDCPPTNKVTITSAAAVFIDPDNGDFRLKQGTNALRDAGTSVSTNPSPVGVTDIGAYEQGSVDAATAVSGNIEVTVNTRTPGILPTSAITGWSVACVGCTGTPVVASAVIKPGATNVVLLTLTGISVAGTCTVSYGAGNMTDSGYIGQTGIGLAQGVNSRSALSVSGNCGTGTGGTVPGSPYLYYKLDDGSGTIANDETANNRDGTLTGSPTWVTSSMQGGGLYFPNDGVDRRLTSPYGLGVDPTTTSFTVCRWVKPDVGISNKIVTASAVGVNQRFYVGTYTGQTWQLGIQSSTYSTTGESEFPVQNKWTSLCIVVDSATDTATLAVDGILGTSSAARKTFTSYTLASNLADGCGFSGTLYCGGYTLDESKIWTSALNAAELLQVAQEFNQAGTPLACHQQKTHKWELTRVDGNGNPVSVGTTGGSVDVVDGGGVALVVQVDCTTTAGAPLAFQFYYSTDGVTYTIAIPTELGAAGIAMWGADTSFDLNRGAATCCISGALTPVSGSTILTSNLSPTVNLAQNQSYTLRLLLRFSSGLTGQSRYILLKQDNGLDLANGYALGGARVNLIANRAGTGF